MQALQMQGLSRQTLDYSCGAAALSFLLMNYFGDTVAEKDVLADIVLRLDDQAARHRAINGFSMLDLKKSAVRLGYDAQGVSLPKSSVIQLKGPVVILLRRKDLNHFVVLKGVSQGVAFLADPSRGHVRIPLHTLFDEWQGEALIVGRAGFGLPRQHGLSIPRGSSVAPQRDSVRVLQQLRAD